MTRLLVTGGSGLLGSAVACRGAEQYESVMTTYLSRSVDFEGVDCRKVDLTDEVQVKQLVAFDPDAVVHCAAMTDVDQCERESDMAERYNVEMSKRVARLAAKADARLIHISTDAVFDGEGRNYTTDDEPNPVNVYGRTKLKAESAIQQIHNDSIVVRTSIYGWNATSGQSLAEWMLSKFREGETFPAFKDAYFTPIYTGDLARCLFELVNSELNGTLHVAGRNRCSKLEFANAISEVFELDERLIQPASIKDVDFEAPRGTDLSLSVKQTRNLLDCSLPGLRGGLENMRHDE
jgi:dTDP-4-dehydrorhamnose reductase